MARHGAALALVDTLGLIKEGWNGFNVVHLAAARMGALMLGFATQGGINAVAAAEPKLLFLMGADDVDPAKFAKSFKVYVGHHGDRGAQAADVVLPGAAYTEKPGTYVNTRRPRPAQREAPSSRRAMRARTGRSCGR